MNEKILVLLAATAVISTCVAICLIIIFVLNRKNISRKKQDLKRIIEKNYIDLLGVSLKAAEKEKERIARNLHDEINPLLVLLSQNIQKHKINIQKNKFEPAHFADDCRLIEKITDGIRASSYELSPSYLQKYGLADSLYDYVRSLNKTGALLTVFQKNISCEVNLLLSAADQLNIYRMSLELINNLVKHSSCSVLNFSLSITPPTLVVELTHNGQGLDDSEIASLMEKSSGLGLRSLQARAIALNANISYRKNSTHSSIYLSVPLKV